MFEISVSRNLLQLELRVHVLLWTGELRVQCLYASDSENFSSTALRNRQRVMILIVSISKPPCLFQQQISSVLAALLLTLHVYSLFEENAQTSSVDLLPFAVSYIGPSCSVSPTPCKSSFGT